MSAHKGADKLRTLLYYAPMPPKHGLDRKIEKKHEEIRKWPLLSAVFNEEESVEKEFECERRYLPKRLLSEEDLLKLSQGQSREIEQCYMRAEDSEKTAHTFRLRRTKQDGAEGELYRVAHKNRIPDSEGRREVQVKFPPTDPRTEEFENLWEKHDWNIISKTRYYIPHRLPNGSTCEIHYDIHHDKEGKLGLDGFVRIEVEFKNDADAVYVEGYHGYQSVLPEWIGQDITGDDRYSGKSLVRDGMPQS